PWESHVMQLAAYCTLVTETYGIRPPYGIIQYSDQAFAIDYSDELEEELLDLLAEMRQDLYASDVDRDHEDWRRCASCGVRGACSQRLG
ncbi:MAG: CRISPR-associated protein Cas4, partial [Phototrophicales bacterium]